MHSRTKGRGVLLIPTPPVLLSPDIITITIIIFFPRETSGQLSHGKLWDRAKHMVSSRQCRSPQSDRPEFESSFCPLASSEAARCAWCCVTAYGE